MPKYCAVRSVFIIPSLAMFISGQSVVSFAAELFPGESATVAAGSPAERWILRAATLTVEPSGQTLGIQANPGSSILLQGATVSGGALTAVLVSESEGVIRDSNITSTNNTGVSVTRGVDPTVRGGVVLIENSSITAAGRGLNVSGGSTATVIGSTIDAQGAVGPSVAGSGLGVSLVGGEALLTDTRITGSNWGAGLFANTVANGAPRLVLDHSDLVSGTGSAIVVSNLSSNAMQAQIEILNGTTLTSANGTLIEVGFATDPADQVAQANILIQASTLSGDIQVADSAVADLSMKNGTVLNGTLNNLRSIQLDASSLYGTVNEPAASTSTMNMVAGSVMSGNVNNIGSLRMDASTLSGNVTSLPGSATTVALLNGSSLTGSVSHAAALSLDNSRMAGELIQDTNSSGTLSLTNGSQLIGTVTNASRTSIDARSRFDMVNDSSVGALSLQDGLVNLRGGNGDYRILTASSLDGTGTFVLGTDLARQQNDLVNIEGMANGSFGLDIVNTGIEPVVGDSAQRVVHTEGGAAQFTLLGLTGLADMGAYSYELERRADDWYLVQASTPIISPSAQVAIAVFSAAPTVWYGEMSTLRSRMGELRQGYGQGGFWARTYGNKYSVSTADQVSYQQTQQGVSFGVDTALPTDSGKWLLGMMGGYSNSQLNMRLGSNGRVDSYYVGLYSTWLSDSGYYLDAAIKANRFDNKADVRMSNGAKADGDYSNYGVGATVEVGKHFKLDDGWFVEPYLQASALWIEGEHYSLDNGLEADSNRADSLLGKVGTHVGRTFPLKDSGFVQPYLKLAAAREFARNNDVTINRTRFHDDLSGGRGEIGAGIIAQVSEVLQLHGNIDYSNGKNIEQPWGVNLGVQFAW